jgi:hypothetical protein
MHLEERSDGTSIERQLRGGRRDWMVLALK